MSETATATAPVVAETKQTKSAFIKEAFKNSASKLRTPANDIADAVKRTHGVEVTPSLINNIRFHLRAKVEERRRGKGKAAKTRKPAAVQPVAPVAVTGSLPTSEEVAQLVKVRAFVNEVGGVENVKNLINRLVDLQTLTQTLSPLAN